MSVSVSTPSIVNHLGNNTLAVYSITFNTFQNSDVEVVVTKVSDGTIYNLVESTDYSLDDIGIPGQNAEITLIDAGQAWISASSFLDSGYRLSLKFTDSPYQPTNLTNLGRFSAVAFKNGLDRLTMLVKTAFYQISKTVQITDDDVVNGVDPVLPTATGQANKVLQLNAAGTGFEYGLDLDAVDLTLTDHIADITNPHSVTKSQVGLSNVVNLDTTTTENITDFTDKRFITDASLAVLLNTSNINTGDQDTTDHTLLSNIGTNTHVQIDSHIADMANPHGVTDITGTAAKADALNSATTVVDVSLATAPIAGQALIATSSTAATWQTLAAGGNVVGPAGATDSNVAMFDGATGLLLKDSGLTLSGSNTGDQTVDTIDMNYVGSPTYTTLAQGINLLSSGGVASGGSITDGGAGTVNISAGQLFIRPSDSDVATIYSGSFPAVTGQALTDNTLNFIYAEYNAGTPQIVVYTAPQADVHSNIIVGVVYREGTVVHITNVNTKPQQIAQKIGKRLAFVNGLTRQSGSVISETGTRNIAITAGAWWIGLVEYSLAASDTAVADTFSSYYSDGVGGFTEVTAQTQIDNLQYDDGSGTLATLGNGKYGVHWVFIGVDGDEYVVYGTDQYTLAAAESSVVPASLPGHMTGFHVALVGRIIIGKSDSVFTEIQNPYDVTFGVGVAASHLDLTDIGVNTHAQIDTHLALRTTKGDLVSYSTVPERLGIGTDTYVLTADSAEATGMKWAAPSVGTGDVVGPASSVNNNVVFFDGVTGKLVKDSGLTLSGSNTGDQTSVSGTSGNTDALNSATTVVNVSSATAPSVGQVLTATSSTAATWQAAAGGNSFETMSPITGTSPVADSATDTLNYASSDSSISITGDSTTDTLDFEVDINGQTVEATVNPAADYVMIYDASALANRKVLINNMPSGAPSTVVLDLASAAAPSLSFTGDSDTGFYSPGANQFGFAAGGAAKMTASISRVSFNVPIFQANGSVGAPAYAFTGMQDGGLYRDSGSDSLRMALNGVLSQTWETDYISMAKILGVGQYATGSLPSASSYEGYIAYDTTTQTMKWSNGTSWATI